MKQGLALFSIIFLLSLPIFSQSNGNEWIAYDQTYFRIKIAEDGIYRISKSTLQNAGFDVSIDPKRIQLFGKEQEQAIYIKGENDGTFNDDDYIEFLAFKNDGWLDSLLYEEDDDPLNPYYSLYNDTLCYYLTYSDETSNLRSTQVVDQNFGAYSTSGFCLVTETTSFTNTYFLGKRNTINRVTDPHYLEGEGYGILKENATQTINFNTTNRYLGSDAPASLLNVRFASVNNPGSSTNASGNHHFRASLDGNVFFDNTFFGYQTFSVSESFSTINFGNSTQIAIGTVNDIGVTDHLGIGYVQLIFPHNYDFEGNSSYSFEAKANGNTKLKVKLSNFDGTNPIVYSIGTSSYRGKAYADGADFQFLIPQNGEVYFSCYIASEEEIHSVSTLKKVNGNGQFTNYAELNYSNAFLIITHESLWESAQQYANYRDISFMPLLVNVEQLYDQYGGGIPKHPLAIRRFANDLIENWNEKPTNLLLLGKSLSPARARAGNQANLVPTIGAPPSDNLLTAGLNGTDLEPAIPSGRIAAKNNEDVEAYLNKLIEFEAQPPAMWMKEVLHFGGGANSDQQSEFKGYLANYEAIIEDTSMGAQVHTYLKNTSTPIEILVNEEITEQINGGVSLMTFFGHANGSGFDINIDQPENYDNQGKYPLMLASSCFTGDIHNTELSNSEHFVLIPDKGSIAYLASVNQGIGSYLNEFNTNFYTHNFKSHYNESIGQNIIRAIQDFTGFPISTHLYFKESTCLEMTLHGDPAIILNASEKPDFEINQDDVFFEPEVLTADLDSFDVSIVLKNMGRATHQPFYVELIRHFPGSLGDSIYAKQVNGLLNYDTLIFTLASHHPFSDGLNIFDISVDALSTVDELSEINNSTSKEYLVKSGQVVPIFPYEQSIIGINDPIITAYAGSTDSSLVNYQFQLSQDAVFSTILEEASIIESDGVILWDPVSSLQNNSVYYWRTASEEDALEGNWRTSSFEYIQDSTGWGQSQAAQFNSNDFQLLNYQESNNSLSFAQGSKNLRCHLYGSRNINENEVFLDLNLVDYGGCGNDTFMFVMVFDPNTLEAWETNYGGANPEYDFGNSLTCRNRTVNYFAFDQNDPLKMTAFYNMLTNGIPDGFHVLVYTYAISIFDNWSSFRPELFTLFTDWGSTGINVNAQDKPFIFYTQKGNNAATQEVMGTHAHDTLLLSVNLPIIGNSGKVSIADMGKTANIHAAQWEFPGAVTGDEFHLKLQQGNSPTALFQSEDPGLNEIINLQVENAQSISGQIRLNDTLNFSPIQFENLRLFYNPPGDAAINANHAYAFMKDSLNEGEDLRLIIGVSNPTPYAMDSLVTRVSIVDAYNSLKYLSEVTTAPLGAYENRIDTIQVSSLGLHAKNRFQFEVNPLDGMGEADQLEQYRFNNKVSIPFYVMNDQTNPIVDVTFDGMHIMNGEIITPQPQIIIQLKDDNEFLVFSEIADTTNLSFFIQEPDGNLEKINYDDPDLQFEFGNTNNNQLKVIYRPTFEKNGKHLLLVQAKDKSGNTSGSRDYEIEFEINRTAAVTQVLNYPNPFSTRTQFVFTLTGTQIPDEFTIRIYTISGKIVKEIYKQDLGTLRIGNNITDYYWDGKDNYGDQLANGVYFYTVDISFYNEDFEQIETEADQYFTKGMGKMYLMR